MVAAVLVAAASTVHATNVLYYYDQLGRLIEVVDQNGNTAQYNYDAAGNITRIANVTGTTLSLAQFVPIGGQVGSTVNIYGSGFSTTPSSNTVKFNGTTATVTAATTTALTVTVPTGATTGTVSVQTSGSPVTSSGNFTLTTSQVPTITSFTPTGGAPGTAITVTGTNFQTTDITNNNVTIGGYAAILNSATSTSLSLTSTTSSGTVAVATPYGAATSSASFYAYPPPIASSGVDVQSTIVPGGSAVTVSTANGHQGLLLFNATKGSYFSMVSSNNTFDYPLFLYLYNPDQSLNLGQTINSVVTGFFPVPISGTYTFAVIPSDTTAGSVQVQLFNDPVTPLVVNGSTSQSLSAGQIAYFPFNSQAGVGYSLQVTSASFSPSGTYPYLLISLLDAYGDSLGGCNAPLASGCYFALTQIPVTGQYAIQITAQDSAYDLLGTSFTIAAGQNVSGSLVVNAGSPTTATTTIVGQGGQYTFSGTAGQNLTTVLTNNTIALSGPTDTTTNVTVYAPFTSTWDPSISLNTGDTSVVTMQNLPDTGTYTVAFAPEGPATGSIDLQVLSFATGTMTVNGTTSISLNTGQSANYSFSATAGTTYSLALSSFSSTPSGATNIWVELTDSSGNLIDQCTAYLANQYCSFPGSDFSTSGTYQLLMSGENPATGGTAYALSYSAVLSAAVTGTLTVNASSATTITTTYAGQNAVYTFSGTAGQYISLIMTSNTMDDGDPTSGNRIPFNIYGPGSTPIAALNLAKGAIATLDLENLPSTGTYTIVMSPQGTIDGSIALQLKTFATGSLTVNSSTSIPLTSGQKGMYTFSGVSGTSYGLAVTSLVLTPTATTPSLALTLLDPYGYIVTECTVAQSENCYVESSLITSTGTYTILVDPGTDSTSQVYSVTGNLVLSKPVTGTLTVNASSATTVNISYKGQAASYTFSGTASQNLKLLVTTNNIPTPTTNFTMYAPDGSEPYSGYVSVGSGGTILMSSLPLTGTYTILMQPSNSGTDSGTGNIKLQVKTQ